MNENPLRRGRDGIRRGDCGLRGDAGTDDLPTRPAIDVTASSISFFSEEIAISKLADETASLLIFKRRPRT